MFTALKTNSFLIAAALAATIGGLAPMASAHFDSSQCPTIKRFETDNGLRQWASGSAKAVDVERFSRERIETLIVREALDSQVVPPELALAVVAVKSDFDVDQHSDGYYVGLMQLSPRAMRQAFGLEMDQLWDPVVNVRTGIHYLSLLLQKNNGDWQHTLACFNNGFDDENAEFVAAVFEAKQDFEDNGDIAQAINSQREALNIDAGPFATESAMVASSVTGGKTFNRFKSRKHNQYYSVPSDPDKSFHSRWNRVQEDIDQLRTRFRRSLEESEQRRFYRNF